MIYIVLLSKRHALASTFSLFPHSVRPSLSQSQIQLLITNKLLGGLSSIFFGDIP